jgi:hypothetical protein
VYRSKIFDFLQLGVAIGLVVFYTQVVWFRERILAHWRSGLVLGTMCLSLLLLLHISAYRDLHSNPNDPLITGRYLLPLIALFGLAIAFVCAHLPRRIGPPIAALLLGTGVLLQLSGLGMTVVRFYG